MNKRKLLSQRIDDTSIEEILDFVQGRINKRKIGFIFAMNVHILGELYQDQKFKKKHEQLSDVIFLDGVPLIWLSKFFKISLSRRVSGTDLTERLLNSKHKIFILGSTQQVLKKINRQYSSVVGWQAPPFGSAWDEKINKQLVTQINSSGAEIVLVGVGALKQERWLLEFLPQTKAKIGIGIGSAFNILAGETPRAPRLLKNHGFEWLWRIYLEPIRLCKRYLVDLWLLIKIIFHHFRKRLI